MHDKLLKYVKKIIISFHKKLMAKEKKKWRYKKGEKGNFTANNILSMPINFFRIL